MRFDLIGETDAITCSAIVDRMDAGGGLQGFGTAQHVNFEIRVEEKFGTVGGKPIPPPFFVDCGPFD
jgi:hypothetical protein